MKPIIAIKLSSRNYAGLVNLGNSVHDGLTTNPAYTTPVPALTLLATQITDVEDGISAWGSKSNRGSHNTLLELRSKAVLLTQTLKSLSQYVMNTAQGACGSDYAAMAAMITSSGFQLANPRNPQGLLQAVKNFHHAVSPRFNPNQVKLLWKKPLNASRGNVKSYRVMRGTTNVLSAATQIAVTTKCRFVDSNETATVQTWYYWVIPVNDAGDGAASESVVVSLFSI